MRRIAGTFAAFAVCLGLFGALPALAGVELVTNGGFETGDFTGWSVVNNPSGFTQVMGAFGDDVQLNPYAGNYFAALGFNASFDPGGPGTVEQTIATTVGQQYTFSFAYFAENGTPNAFSASFGDQTVFAVTNDTSFTTNPITWLYQSFAVTADSPSTTIAFVSYNNPFYDGLDSVSVQAIPNPTPEPSSVAVWGLGAAAVFFVSRRRRST